MKRKVDELLLKWKNSPNRKPLLVCGARQIGKTYSIVEFGQRHFKDYVYFNFEANSEFKTIFEKDLNPQRIIMELGVVEGKNITPETLVFFDEIQAVPKAVTSLKYFYEKMPDQPIVAAGSLLGVALEREEYSFPVGKVNLIDMYPMNFEEFLMATENGALMELIEKAYLSNEPLSNAVHSKALELYREFLVVGGMPEVVKEYIESKDAQKARVRQAEILRDYTVDMAKYATKRETIKHEATYNSVPAQLAKDNRKFQYSMIGSAARAREYEFSIEWLNKAGLILRCDKAREGKIPLEAYKDITSYKIYMSDVGLLTAKQLIPVNNVLVDKNLGGEAKGAMTENYLATQLRACGHELYYWESNSIAEVDFVIQLNGKIVPIECKSSDNVRSRSLGVFMKKYGIEEAIRVSAKNFGFENGIKSVPLYAAWCIRE